jgi:hypothetical protein
MLLGFGRVDFELFPLKQHLVRSFVVIDTSTQALGWVKVSLGGWLQL